MATTFQRIVERYRGLSRRERVIAIATVSIVSLLLMDRVIVQPIRYRLLAMDEKIELRAKQIVQNQRNIRLRPPILQRYEQIAGRVKVRGNDDQIVTEMLHEIERVGSSSEVPMANVRPRPSKDYGFYRILSAELEAHCTMEKLLTFLYQLQQSAKLFQVENLKIRASEDDVNQIRVTLTLNQFVIPENPTSPPL